MDNKSLPDRAILVPIDVHHISNIFLYLYLAIALILLLKFINEIFINSLLNIWASSFITFICFYCIERYYLYTFDLANY